MNGAGERGALGIALSPRWPAKKVVYVYVTRSGGGHLQNQLVRFNVRGGTGHGLKVLLRSPASADPYHNGGRILFGPDHKLYVMIGDGHHSVNAQDRSDNFRGKILRLDPDGTGAKGNPFGSRIWSYGHRNSYGFTFDPATAPPLGDGERSRVHRRDQPRREGRELRVGPEGVLLARQAGRHEQLRTEAAAPPEALLPVDDRDHG